jgi:hypothetical protein
MCVYKEVPPHKCVWPLTYHLARDERKELDVLILIHKQAGEECAAGRGSNHGAGG